MAGGLFLGALLSVQPLMDHLTKNIAPYLPKVALAKAVVDADTGIPHEITQLGLKDGKLVIETYPDDGRIKQQLKNMGVPVK